MSNSCVTGRLCGANRPGWLVGDHPSVSEGVARRRVCFASSNSGGLLATSCCRWSTYVMVRNCGTFFVYKLHSPPACNLRYCGDGIPTTTRGKILCPLFWCSKDLERRKKGVHPWSQFYAFNGCLYMMSLVANMMKVLMRSKPLSLTTCLHYHSLAWIY